mgnify:CR=1 FL=1
MRLTVMILLLISPILLGSINHIEKFEKKEQEQLSIEIVVARFNEDLNWLENPIF